MPFTNDPDASVDKPVRQREATDGAELDALAPLHVVVRHTSGTETTVTTATWAGPADADPDGGWVRWLRIPLAGRAEGKHYLRGKVTGDNDIDFGTVQMLGPAP